MIYSPIHRAPVYHGRIIDGDGYTVAHVIGRDPQAVKKSIDAYWMTHDNVPDYEITCEFVTVGAGFKVVSDNVYYAR